MRSNGFQTFLQFLNSRGQIERWLMFSAPICDKAKNRHDTTACLAQRLFVDRNIHTRHLLLNNNREFFNLIIPFVAADVHDEKRSAVIG